MSVSIILESSGEKNIKLNKKIMKKQDIDRLKEICEKEGFDIKQYDDDGWLIRIKQDPWEGAEFARNINSKVIYPINELTQRMRKDVILESFCISTEAAYVRQLKEELFKRVGNIDVNDLDLSEMQGGNLEDKLTEFRYNKPNDTLFFWGKPVYQQGVWAKKKRVEVEYKNGFFSSDRVFRYDFTIKNFNHLSHSEIGHFLASQLEKYLNDEK